MNPSQERHHQRARSRDEQPGIRIKNKRVRRDAALSITRRQIVLITVMLIFFMMSGIGYVWSNYERTQRGYDLSRLKQEELRLRELNRKLRLELAFLKAPQHLAPIAVKELGLQPAMPDQIVVLP